jgi:hypothetical protein
MLSCEFIVYSNSMVLTILLFILSREKKLKKKIELIMNINMIIKKNIATNIHNQHLKKLLKAKKNKIDTSYIVQIFE